MSGSMAHVYSTDGLEHPAQDQFTQQYDLGNPDAAARSYQRIMHQHTKQQFELATASSRRRSANSGSIASLTPESSQDSVDSTAS
ncbi:hypothetical protein CLAFUW4_06898 [Fulvia fulva]|uniref:Uncharacterized protein n=1 Tax=Passalora fulva TaxID=5499 RepID=A0A9Q8UR17_PASFU|nr:uncharacterized protein CLAFUR5_07036 [Fulvia fulva]KAK4621801.1 hypothetical protein CLAFUR4_06906 [Fulvia fulva]KAK4623029.1 hypothetical protein CLAFUR0_06903 [Fulvia fulva]UJO19272.1 hypothetical protein CLAFUR5_07036 [Fulvia fulva]WPV15781.1 hypothetical protein CLAFUW4_06898 [Fulvia fulva]WPV31403.1 hypothetical protein CLAFUW7_06897 [Fulvia fulva]